MSLSLTFWNWLLALLPLLTVVVLMLVFRWGGGRAGGLGWLTAVVVAVFFFGAGFELLAVAQVKSVLLSLDVFYIIWTALLLFSITKRAGAIDMIGKAMTGLTEDRVMQSILISWVMVAFLQGTGGFGVPVAICAPLLVGLGFSPIQAVAMASVGHGWAVSFGSFASSFQTLIAVTGLPWQTLAPLSALILGLATFPCGLLVVIIGTGWKSLKRGLMPVLLLSILMGTVQYVLVVNGVWTMGATGAGLVGLVALFLMLRLPKYRNQHDTQDVLSSDEVAEEGKSLWVSLIGYGILVVLAFAVNLISPLKAFLNQVALRLEFPEVATSFGWVTPAGAGQVINLFSHPGALILYTCILSFVLFRWLGYLKAGDLRRIIGDVVRSGVNSSTGILAMVGMASIMLHSGMTILLAQGLSESFSQAFYPIVAPFIGALGAFITGSNMNSNVLFAVLQQNTAEMMNLSVPLILAAQTAGASLGSVLAPSKVIVGCSTVGLAGKEGEVMRKMLFYGIIPIVIVALTAWIISRV
ncbi:MAG: L-lactate permease [Brevefilum sp.]|jgi:lactate permease